jgi:hypothetical protein
MNSDHLENQALAILDFLSGYPFEQCAPITRNFTNLTANASLYAIRHRELGLLYVGKTGVYKRTISRRSQSLSLVMARLLQLR